MLASRARVCRRGVALSVHLSGLERSHSATPVAVRALCPPQCVALLPSLPPLPFFLPSLLLPPLLLLLLLTAASSAVSTGHQPTPRSMSCLSHTVRAAITLTHKMHMNTVCVPTHYNGHTLQMKSHTHCPGYV